jgi:hypothetical protein
VEYVSTVGSVELGGVDRSGAAHKPLVFKGKTPTTIPDDEGQTYDQTIRLALEAGTIKPVKEGS